MSGFHSVTLAASSESPLWASALFSLKRLLVDDSAFFILQLGGVIAFQGYYPYANNSTEFISSPDFFPELQTQIPSTMLCFQYPHLTAPHVACPKPGSPSLLQLESSLSQSGTQIHKLGCQLQLCLPRPYPLNASYLYLLLFIQGS